MIQIVLIVPLLISVSVRKICNTEATKSARGTSKFHLIYKNNGETKSFIVI